MKTEPATSATVTSRPRRSSSARNASNPASLPTKPSSGGSPAIDAAAAAAVIALPRSDVHSPESRRTSRVPVAWSIVPVTRNSGALNSPCASSIAIPAMAAIRVPAPNRTMRKPSWLTVPKASSRLRSCCASARQPPTAIVARPSTTIGTHHTASSATPGDSRATRYTPAFTIDAACR